MKDTLILLTTLLLLSTFCFAQTNKPIKPTISGFKDYERYDNEDALHIIYKNVPVLDSFKTNGGHDAYDFEQTGNKKYILGFLHSYPKMYIAKNKPKHLGEKGKYAVVPFETGAYIILPLDTTDKKIFVAYPPYYYFVVSNSGVSDRCNRFVVDDSTQSALHNQSALVIKNILTSKKRGKISREK